MREGGMSETPRTDAARTVYENWTSYAKKYGHLPEAMEQAPNEADPFYIADALERELSAERAAREQAERELAEARAECERLREDAERYQLLLQRFYIANGMLRVSDLFLIHEPGASVAKMLETAIDAARGSNKSPESVVKDFLITGFGDESRGKA